ncbi:hypothetical protein [Salegentibacter salegens]|uniref:Uncharacterized protein n=1 Tax=Salegentibacter salegens TaxID=143223 RepID=A0A1M7LAA9_9FLAO|nr:hypothetical protein [Salegentibacter salegens]PRX40775.1 hypothetical protein LY58_03104 [Salegentibacter salegens]SHM74329.1 hypothetical protein SAMN05878281_1797 [Salegentibacter salegens]
MKDSPRRARFEKVAANRVANILKGLESLEKCSNKNNYEYNPDDIRKMEKALKDKVSDVLKSFNKELDKGKNNEFKF